MTSLCMRVVAIVAAMMTLACGGNDAVSTSTPDGPGMGKPAETELFVFSHDSPHISVIDTAVNKVTRTADVHEFNRWTSNDDNNHFDGENLWLGMKYPKDNDAVVISLNLDTLQVSSRMSIGKEGLALFIGKATKNGVLHVAKQATGQIVSIDTKTSTILNIRDVPVHGGEACDADVSMGPDGVERLFYPTKQGDTLISMDVGVDSVDPIKVVKTPDGTHPLMLTVAPGGMVWVQESGSNTNAVFDPISLDLIKRFPSGRHPEVVTFSPDGKYAYVGHSADSIVQVIDTYTFQEITRIDVGSFPHKVAVHPNGEYIYAIVSKAKTVAVIETASWNVVERIDIGVKPSGLFLRSNAKPMEGNPDGVQGAGVDGTLHSENRPQSPTGVNSVNTDSTAHQPPNFSFSVLQRDEYWTQTMGGASSFTLDDVIGKHLPVVMHFTSASCETCTDDMKIYQNVYRKRGDEFLLMIVDVGILRGGLDQFFDNLDYTAPYLNAPDGKPVGLYQLYRVPATVMITDDGRLWKKLLWRMDQPQLEAFVDGLITESDVEIPAAQERNPYDEWNEGR